MTPVITSVRRRTLRNLRRNPLHEFVNQIDANSMELDVHLVLWRLRSGFVEVEYQPAPRELEPIPLFQPVEKGPRLFSGLALHQAITESSFQIEVEQRRKLA